MNLSLFLRKFDWRLFFIFLAISAVGLFSMAGMGPSIKPFLEKQILFLIIGSAIIFFISLLDYRVFKNSSLPSLAIYLTALILLVISLTSSSVRGINAWISFGSIRLEPSEFAKLSVVILLAKYFSQKHAEIYRIHHVVASGIYTLIPALLVLKQPDLGSAFIFFAIWLSMLLAVGIKRKHLMIILLSAVLVASVAWLVFLQPYQKNRISSFLNPYLDSKGEGYSVIQAKTAIGSGMIWGNGYGQGTQSRFGFLPEAHTDFAFAAYGEQFGFAGISVLFALFFLFLLRIGKIGFGAKNNFAKLFSIGFVAFIFSHVVINAGMNLGLMPITGIPFPFLSYGGSFLISLSLGIGLLESIKIRN